MQVQLLSERLRSRLAGLSRRARVSGVAGLILAATFVPSLCAAPAEARMLLSDSQSDPVAVAPAPARVDPSSRGGLRNPAPAVPAPSQAVAPAAPAPTRSEKVLTALPDTSSPTRFIASVAPAAQESQRATGVPASVTIAQAILESEWGRSGLSKKAQNYFGIKAFDGPGPAGTISMDTWEVFGGKNTVIDDAFKAYNNMYESVMDHGTFLKENPRYADAFKTTDPKEFARRIHKDGYATDPDYCDKVNSLIDKYGLAKYDALGLDKK